MYLARLRPRLRTLSVVLALAAATVAPSLAQSATPRNITRGCVDRYDAAADYFPDKAAIADARNFRVEYRRSFKVVTVSSPAAGDAADRYVLVQCGTPPPPLDGALAGAQVVTVPIRSLYAASTTQLPPLVDLGRLEVLAGVSNLSHLSGKEILAHVRRGQVKQFAALSVVDAEQVVAGRPSLLMSGGSSPALSVIRGAGIPVVADSAWLEQTALGRSEWLKYMALFLNEERLAERLHGEMKGRYGALRTRATARPESAKPLVMTGRADRGVFGIAGGRSYVAALIADAGGRYTWADNEATGAATVDLEAHLRRSANADIWINGSGWKSLAAMLEDEPRYAGFKAFRTGQVWVYDLRVPADGANDYWTRSVSHPDLVLADLVKIFHPADMRDRAFEWYMQVPAR